MSRSPIPRALAVVSFVVLPLALTGCSGDDPPTPAPSQSSGSASSSAAPSTPAASATASPSGSPSASASASASATATAPKAPSYSLKDVTSAKYPALGPDLGTVGTARVGHHTGFDRVVWQFPGPDTPNYQVRYVKQPLGDASGDPQDIAGKAYLEVMVTSLGMPEDTNACPRPLTARRLTRTVLAEVESFCGGFEGVGQAFVGLDRQRPFRVLVFDNPSRLVVDIRTS